VGGDQTEQPRLGKESVSPTMEVPPLGIAPAFAPFAEDRTQTLADEPVQWFHHFDFPH